MINSSGIRHSRPSTYLAEESAFQIFAAAFCHHAYTANSAESSHKWRHQTLPTLDTDDDTEDGSDDEDGQRLCVLCEELDDGAGVAGKLQSLHYIE